MALEFSRSKEADSRINHSSAQKALYLCSTRNERPPGLQFLMLEPARGTSNCPKPALSVGLMSDLLNC